MKKILLILFIIMLIITFSLIISTYALYKDSISGDYATALGKWVVKVNEQDITTNDGQIVDFQMQQTDMSYLKTEYIAGTGIAPDSEGCFSLKIDAMEADVAVKYSISIGEITQYRVYPDDWEDGDEIPVAQNLTTPFTFEVQGVEDVFSNDEGQLRGEPYVQNNTVDKDINAAIGILPLQPSTKKGCKDNVTVTFKWLNDDENKALEDALIANNKTHDELRNNKFNYTSTGKINPIYRWKFIML